MNIKTEDSEYLTIIKQEPDGVKCELQSETPSEISIKTTKCKTSSETSSNEKNQTEIYCHVCYEKFINLDQIKIHYEQAHSTTKCNLCNIFLKNEIKFKIHNEKFHSGFAYKNENSSIVESSSVEDSVKDEPNTNQRCLFCYELFSNINELHDHVKVHTQVTLDHDNKVILYKCKICGICCSHREDLVFHKELHSKHYTSKLNHHCFYCSDTFSSPSEIFNHNVNYILIIYLFFNNIFSFI